MGGFPLQWRSGFTAAILHDGFTLGTDLKAVQLEFTPTFAAVSSFTGFGLSNDEVNCMQSIFFLRPLALGVATLSLPVSLVLAAETEVLALNTITVTSGIPQDETEQTQASTVVTRAEIEAGAYTDVTEILRRIPGVEFRQAGGPGQYTNLKIRGLPSKYALVVIDGIVMNRASSGNIGNLLGQLNPATINRIEVLRGPRAARYGANSIGGVIAITTRAGLDRDVSVYAEAGSLGYRELGAALNDKVKAGEGLLHYSLNAAVIDSDGIHDEEYFEDETVQVRLGYELDQLKLGVSHLQTNNEFGYAELDEPFGLLNSRAEQWSFQTPDPDQYNSTDTRISSVSAIHTLSSNWQQELRLAHQETRQRFIDGNDGLLGYARAPFDNFEFDVNGDFSTDPSEIFAQGDLIPIYDAAFATDATYTDRSDQANYELLWEHTAVTVLSGLEYASSRADQQGSYGTLDGEASHFSGYLDSSWTAWTQADRSWVVSAGVRHDDHDNWGSQWTGSLGSNLTLASVSLFANVATSFRAPEQTALFNPTYGNPALEPEKGESVELGLSQNTDQFDWGVSAWFTELDEVILYDFNAVNPNNPFGFGQYVNGNRGRTSGVELHGAVALTKAVQLSGNYTYTDSHVLGADGEWERSEQIAHDNLNVGVDYQAGPFGLTANVYYTGPRLRWNRDVEMDAYTRVDVSGRYDVSDLLQVYGRIENLFDADIEEGLGYEAPGVYGIAGVKARF